MLCAVSGGEDSMCLLHLLKSNGVDVTAAHYEHGIRGGESLRDARFVERVCEEWGIKCVVGHGDVPKYAKEHAVGIEEAARALRYEFLEQTRRELGLELIATAHNADDNAETMLFNLTRGSGAKGLAGIPETRGCIVRPLLRADRQSIEEYNRDNGVPHTEDSSNDSDDYSRNLIRHRVMPALREINPRLAESAARTGELLRRDDDFLSSLADAFIKENLSGGSLPLDGLCELNSAVSSRVLRKLLGNGLSMERCDAVLRFASGSGQGLLEIPGGTLRRGQGRLYLEEQSYSALPDRRLKIGESLLLPEAGLIISSAFIKYSGEINEQFKTYYLRCEILGDSLSVGSRRAGDRMRPMGRGCGKTLKALYTEKKLTQRQRDTYPVIRDDKGIVLAYGLAADERTKAEKGERAVKIEFEKIEE